MPPGLRLFKDARTIAVRVEEIADALSTAHRGRRPLVIGLLSGAFVFLADLVRGMCLPVEVEFWRLASYGRETVSSGQVREPWPLMKSVRGRHVIVVEDIVDTGRTLAHVRSALARGGPASVTVVALLKKVGSRVPVDYVGFHCGPDFVVGYGLDLDGDLRNLPALYYFEGRASPL